MRKTKAQRADNKVAVNAESLAEILDCGRATAVKIGTAAGARFQIGKRVLFKMDKINAYLDQLSEEGCNEQEVGES